jgi:hypothetical protein
MNSISQCYRQACREIELPKAEKELFMRLLREISINAIRFRKAWNIKEDFISLWFVSAGRFPELASNPYNKEIGDWIAKQLPFELTNEEQLFLWSKP